MSAKRNSANRTVVFRTEGSREAGFGHVSRCLSLAEALKSLGVDSLFAVRSTAAEVSQVIAGQGHPVRHLPGPDSDARPLQALTRQTRSPLICVDTYKVDADYLAALQDAGFVVVYIDDLGRFPVTTQVLVNYNAYAVDLNYQLGAATRALLGPRYALLRRRFSELRRRRSTNNGPRNALLLLGGSDLHQRTAEMGRSLLAALPSTLRLTVVVGPASGRALELAELPNFESRLTVRRQPNDLAEIMARTDIAVTGAGVTSYELACLGVPSLLLILSENQLRTAEAFGRMGVAEVLGWHEDLDPQTVGAAAASLWADKNKLSAMARQGRQLVDGRGAERVALEIVHEIDSHQ